MSEWKFKRDTAFRKQFFVPDSFAHPAKMDAQLLIKIVEEYTQVGETILDPMAGSGTTMLACTLGRNVVLVELEEKFCKMMRDNWNEVKMRPQLGSQMGDCQIIQGDARWLEGLVDKIVTSPPYAEVNQMPRDKPDPTADKFGRDNIGKQYSEDPHNIGNSPYGQIDKIVTSPPYADEPTVSESYLKIRSAIGRDTTKPSQRYRKYSEVDSIITSPPYEGSVSATTGGERDQSSARQREKRLKDKGYDPAKYQGGVGRNLEVDFQYSKDDANIGNLKSDTYLQAMLQVYQQCYKVLKQKGSMILVTKNFIRNKKVIRLDVDTILLCGQAGFKFVERHKRKLPGQSFWRIIYHQKHPEVEQINYEDVLVFRR